MPDVVKTYTIPEANVPELVNAFGDDYSPFLDEEETIPNPQSKPAYASQQFDRYVRQAVKLFVRKYRLKVAKRNLLDDFDINI